MHDPIVIDPPDFNQDAAWDECRDYVEKSGGLGKPDGEPNWRAAFGADPGVVLCPSCRRCHWRWGSVQRCTDEACGFEYPTDWWSMYSYGVSAGEGGLMGRSEFHETRMDHPFYRHGYENPPGEGAWDAAFKIDWPAVIAGR